MMKLNKVFSVALLATVVVFSSCNKEEESVNKNQTLTTKSWMISKMEMSYGGQTVDITDDMEDCEKDNSVKFNSDGKYEENVGADDCDGDEESSTGTWKWNTDETAITIVTDGISTEAKLKSISSGSMVLEYAEKWDMDFDGTDETEIKVITTFKAK